MRHFILAAILLTTTATILAQDLPKNPDRGAKVGNAYALGDFETINTTNGNLMLNFPLGSLPSGRGNVGGSVSLVYNSKLWDMKSEKIEDFRGSPYPPYFDKSIIYQSDTGGWTMTPGVTTIEYENRSNEYNGITPSCPNGQGDTIGLLLTYTHKVRVILPDGSKHEMIPNGYADTPFINDGFYKVTHDGWIENCGGARSRTGNAMIYHSIDGTFLRLEYSYDNDENPSNNTWMLYMPDGSRFDGSHIYDRNGNSVSYDSTGVADQLDRSVSITTDINGDTLVNSKGVGGEDIVWTVKWKYIFPFKTYESCEIGRCTEDHFRNNVGGTMKVVDRIVQPEQLGVGEYIFSYNAPNYDPEAEIEESYGWGEISSIQLPSGATVNYEYVMDGEDGPEEFFLTPEILKNYPDTKTVNSDLEYDGSTTPTTETWSYNIENGISTVTSPDGGVTTDLFGTTDGGGLSLPWDSGLSFRTVEPNGTMVEKLWAMNHPANCSGCPAYRAVNTYVDAEFTSIKDVNGNYTLTAIKDYTFDKNGNITEVKEYDWIPYANISRTNGLITAVPTGISSYLKRISKTTYYNDTPEAASTTYTDPDSYHLASSKRLLRLPKSSEVQDGSATPVSRSEITYDYTNYDSSNTKAGNPTESKVWDSFKGGAVRAYSNPLTGTNSITTSATYNSYGMPLTSTDANGYVTQITYGNVAGPSGNVTDLYPTQTVSAYGTSLARTSTAVYDFYTGAVTTATDVDNNVSVVNEYDDLGRSTKVRTAAGTALESWTRTEYDDVARRVIVRGDLETVGDGKKVAVQHYDQLGRVRLSRSLENPWEDPTNETHGIKVETQYQTGNPNSYQLTSNPFRAATATAATNEPTMGWTRSKSWNTGRRAETETFSGSALPAPWGSNSASTGVVVTESDANATTVTDQASKVRRSITNALGQLIRVDEPNNAGQLGSVTAPNQPTYYSYNTLGKMVHVQQDAQNRYFMHDSLGRLLRVKQPEQEVNTALNTSGNPSNNSWTAGFTYDNNGNVITTTDAKGTVSTSGYDALNRPTSRTYSDSTPSITLTYDDQNIPLSKGKLTKVASSVSESRYTQFDVLGRTKQFQQYTDGQTYTSTYEYNLSGALIKETYPSGREVKNEFDPNGDIARIFGKATPTATERTYANSFTYTADGRIERLRLGNGLWEAAKFNNRLQVTEFSLGHGVASGDVWKNIYEYGELQTNGTVDATKNSGNIGKQTVTFSGLTQPFVQTYKYDPLYRLTEAKETSNGNQTWKQVFEYDRYGNRLTHDKFIGTTQLTLNEETHPAIDNTTNRFSGNQGYTFDKNGNVIVDAEGRQFTFNGDNKQTEVKDDQNNIVGQYYYDGEGKRIKKVTVSETTVFVYSGSKLIAEYSTATPPSNPTTSYTVTDQLGSPRVIVNALGAIVSRRDFMPFGEEIVPDGTYRTTAQKYGSPDSVRQKFTGYQKDEETGLDFAEARMYENRHARFTVVDPLLASGKSTNPQTFNRYVYVMNSPLVLTDPDGLQAGSETGFALRHPIIASQIGQPTRLGTDIASVATRFATNSDFSSNRVHTGEVTEINALRHTILSAIITARFGKDIAKEATDIHEGTSELPSSKTDSVTFKDTGTADVEADLRNNQIGFEIGAGMEEKSNKEIAVSVLTHFKDNGLNVLKANSDGTTSVITTKIGQQQFDNTLKEWSRRENRTGFSPQGRKEYDDEERKKIEKNLSKNARTAEE